LKIESYLTKNKRNTMNVFVTKIKQVFSIGLCILAVLVAKSSQAQINYIRTFDATAPEQNATALMGRWVSDVKTATQYIDGLGRPIQTVLKQGSLESNSNALADVVAPTIYDALGRTPITYLPFAANNFGGNTSIADGAYKTNALDQQNAFATAQYPGETHFYSKTNFEPSPLNRPTDTYAPGTSWSGSELPNITNPALQRNVQMKYYINTIIDDVKIWDVTNNATIGNFGTYEIATLNNGGVYPAGELYKNITIDEHKKQVIEFKDKEGKVILKKVQLTAAADNGTGANTVGWLCTYYIYDELNNLRLVIQPEGVKQLVASNWQLAITNPTAYTTLLEEQCFRYEYDARGRMVKKKVPGAGEVCMVYDAKDRLVMTQDANMRSQQKWMYSTYDLFNRPSSTGLITDPTNYNNLGFHLNAANASTTAYPNVTSYASEELSNTFYDNYNWLANYSTGLTTFYDNAYNTYFQTASNTTWPYAQNNVQSINIKGMPTGRRTKILGTTNTYLYSITFYDEKGRPIQSQGTNITGGKDIATTQYTWAGQTLVVVSKQEKQGTNAQTTVSVSQMTYDDLGRAIKTEKKLSNTLVDGGNMAVYKTITKVAYNKVGQVVDKTLAPEYNNGAGLETQKFDYNIRGWLLGMNRPYAKEESGAPNNYFGFDLGYDKTVLFGTQTYNRSQYNGNVAGTEWRSKGDGKKRKYDYSYDAANRLLQADFNQYSAANIFDKTDGVDFTLKMGAGVDALGNEVTPNSAYDANGNILQMQQWALKINTSTQIDNLKYTYIAGTNKLKSVTDFNNDAFTKLGDFKTNATHPQASIKTGLTAVSPQTSFDNITDYTYDVNGNINIDNNKAITSITYNHLNLPKVITVFSKGTITYTYDAGGSKIKKEVAETGQPIKTTLYLGGAVFENDVMQFMGHEEGRIRFKPAVLNAAGTVTTPASFAYDYMIKDHLGSTRALLTDEIKIDRYPTATLEGAIGTTTSPVEKEKAYFDINTSYVQDQPLSMPTSQNYLNDNGTNNPNTFGTVGATSQKMYKTNAATNKTGLGMVLKVMAGDKINILAKSYYFTNVAATNSPFDASTLINAFLGTGLAVGAAGNAAVSHGATVGGLTSNTTGTFVPVGTFTNNNPANPYNNVKAGLAYILFDEQFNYAGGSFDPVLNDAAKPAGGLKAHFLQDIPVPKNGYIYIYCSNESNKDVFFDNLEVVHQRCPILEETHYSAWGSKLLGISAQAATGIKNNFNYTGKELQNAEWLDGSGLEEYDYGARFLDPQLGVWHSIDPLADISRKWSPYNYAYSNPIKFIDPDGMSPVGTIGVDELTNEQWIESSRPGARSNMAREYKKQNRNEEKQVNDQKAEIARVISTISMGEGAHGNTFSNDELILIGSVYINLLRAGKSLTASSFYNKRNGNSQSGKYFRTYMSALGSKNYAPDKDAAKELGEGRISRIKQVYATFYTALTDDSYTNAVLSNPGIQGQGYWGDMNKYWDPTWNQRGWYAAYHEGNTNTIIRILGNDADHRYTTYLFDVNAISKWFSGYGKGIDALRTPQLNPATGSYIWFDPPNPDLSDPRK
jgi:RHS repeat-associated protein